MEQMKRQMIQKDERVYMKESENGRKEREEGKKTQREERSSEEEEEEEAKSFPPPYSAHCHASLQKSQLEHISPDRLQLA
ncbi:hypothetical protein EYF80_008991 [Liparis tanakae]|uniref:Uncharacterized protein n=1 Tax=Liparis tanakae TaxID=230148 RepID=A0A4Z2ISL0_9TELE|nr:hypothetical protein EYF80_008991 [Liparis tanakae]